VSADALIWLIALTIPNPARLVVFDSLAPLL
jgi:hypothetical protein